MAYLEDPDLAFLGDLENSESLNTLVRIITTGSDGNERLTETLTNSEKYKKFKPDHKKYWQEIAEEVQLFGGNTIANLLRLGKGVPYREILTDVASHMKVKVNKTDTVEKIENALMMGVLQKSMEKMSLAELEDLAKDAGLANVSTLTVPALMGSLQTAFNLGGFQSYKYTLMITNAVIKQLFGKGLTLAANASLTRTASILAGPVGWAITGAWTAIDLASPATRVTIPAVFEIARLRQQHKLESQDIWEKIKQKLGQ